MSYPLPANDPLGTDLRLDSNGDLVLTMSGSLDAVTHEENVAQTVRVNLTTLPYTYLWGTNVGTLLAQYVDAPITESLKKEIKNIVMEKVSADQRILEVLDVLIDDSYKDMLVLTVVAVVDTIGVVQIPVQIG
ncbi:hypothetical protein DNHGIG_25940 [Collibacillus ludicampi]|uniref:DUF2634 domain-containing protein n=1 Tax=Collibacillus ludicampi TaxID=2771369 RepID=A0AAV4LGQ3_9BACL|nr:hypothetical protein [Collibacillus ludicampi]GIM47045.1 hypothetical protein DNHGIG_25940 [Collibacillus ludicampi]